jgi:hypothetical protein
LHNPPVLLLLSAKPPSSPLPRRLSAFYPYCLFYLDREWKNPELQDDLKTGSRPKNPRAIEWTQIKE